MKNFTKDMQIYQHLRSQILDNEFRPGARLIEDDICRRYDMTRTPVRQALRKLEQEGLVVSEPFAGCHVREVMFTEIGPLFEIREVLEGLAARNVARKASEEAIEELRQLALAVDLAAASEDWSGYFQRDQIFHQRMIQLAGNHKVTEILQVSNFHIRSFALYDKYLLDIVSAVKQLEPTDAYRHSLLVQPMVDRHPEAAEEALRAHIRLAMEQVLDIVARQDGTEPGWAMVTCAKPLESSSCV